MDQTGPQLPIFLGKNVVRSSLGLVGLLRVLQPDQAVQSITERGDDAAARSLGTWRRLQEEHTNSQLELVYELA